MNDQFDNKSQTKGKLSKVLKKITSVYAALYFILLVSFLFENDSTTSFTYEGVIVLTAFLVFAYGFYVMWKNELKAALIFIFWWTIMWYLGLFVAEMDRGAGVVMGFPLFIIALLFIYSWYKK